MNLEHLVQPLSKKELFPVMLWCIVYLYYIALLNKALNQVCALPIGTNFEDVEEVFNLFTLVDSKTLEMFSKQKRRKDKHKFGGTKFWKAEEVTKYFVNSKTENEVFD